MHPSAWKGCSANFRLEVLGEGGRLKALKLEDYAPRKARPGSLQQSLFPYDEAWG
jgi:hypothetical protein